LSEFARRLYYSKGHVSRIETGSAKPSVEFARRCDAELGAQGSLAALLSEGDNPPHPDPEPDHDDDGVWFMAMTPEGNSSLVPVGRRDMLVGGAALLAGLTRRQVRSRRVDATLLRHHAELLALARALGQVSEPEAVLPMVVGQAHALRMLSGEVRGADARAVARLSARTAEFAGWMAQEAGDDRMAMWWTGRAVRAAAEAGDRNTATYALVRRALVTMYQGDAAATISLARRAGSVPGTPRRVLGLAAQREAQGHALAGDHTACMRALETARSHFDAAGTEDVEGLVIGTSFVPDPVVAATGWCLYDLGRPAEAAAVLAGEVERIDPTAIRARSRFAIRQACAHAAAGDVERACTMTQSMLGRVAVLNSATLRADLRRLAATLRRFSRHAEVRALLPVLTRVLYPATA
jgi:hypothetical protein